MKHAMNIIGLVLSFVPLIASAVAFALLPDVVPTHFDVTLTADSWGPSYHVFILGGIMTAVDLLCAVCMFTAEKMMRSGLVHGTTTPGSTRAVLLGTIIFVDILHVGILLLTHAV